MIINHGELPRKLTCSRSVIKTLKLFNELNNNIKRDNFCIISITTPTARLLQVPNNKRGEARWIALRKWRLRYISENETSKQWVFSEDKPEIVLYHLVTNIYNSLL